MPRKRSASTNERPELPPSTADFVIMMKPKREGGKSTRIGAGFKNEWGGINFILSTGVNISFRDCHDHWLTLWPNDKDEEIPF